MLAKINTISLKMQAKAGENGKLFGSITTKEIAEKLKFEQHIVIDKRKIVLPEGIKSTGTFSVEIKVYHDVSAKVEVVVIPL